MRRLKQHVYDLVHDNDPVDQLHVLDIEEDADFSDLHVVFGVGTQVIDLADGMLGKVVRITDDAAAQPVRLSEAPNVPELPIGHRVPSKKYDTIQDEMRGAVRAWRTDYQAYTPTSQLWKFYSERKNLELEKDDACCLLISSMHQRCPFHYWASKLNQQEVVKVLQDEVQKDRSPGIRYAARLAFALGMVDGHQIFKQIANSSRYAQIRTLASRLHSELEKDSGISKEYRSPTKSSHLIDGKEVTVDTFKIFEDKDRTERILSRLTLQSDPRVNQRVKQLDALFYGLL